MKFGTFVFPVSRDPRNDHRIINETLEEIVLCDEVGFDTVWLSEHHFDGATAYVDPVVFAAAVATNTTKVRIGFAVVEMALHHPVRLASQTALLDNLSEGRLLVGTGRGSAFNEYEYIGFGVPMADAANSLIEAESLIVEAWKGEPVNFKGQYWDVSFPGLRPVPFQKPHPPLLRACLSLDSTKEMAQIRRPILIGAQDNESIAERITLYREELESSSLSEVEVTSLLDQIWVSKDVLVGDDGLETVETAQRGYTTEQAHFRDARERFNPTGDAGKKAGTDDFRSVVIAGTPSEVSDQIDELRQLGVRNLMMKMNTGEMEKDTVEKSIQLFAKEVMPKFSN